MRTAGRIRKGVRTAGYAVLRHIPKARWAVRRMYWNLQKSRYDKMASSVPVEPRKVFFEAYGGRSYACSPKALYRAMLADDRFADCSFVWSFRADSPHGGEGELARAEMVTRGSQKYFEALASASTIIMNNRLPEYVSPKTSQTYVQCWHGTPLKRLGYDVEIETQAALNTASELAQRFGIDAKKWTYLLSPSPYASMHLADAFGLPEGLRDSVVLEAGYPRNDELAQAKGERETCLEKRRLLGIPEGKKALLYAPTWRDDCYEDGVGYTFDYLLDFSSLKERLGEDWVVLFRAHYYVANTFDFSAYEDFVIDVSDVEDINDAFIASDALLTDYSSVMFDYANLQRPILLFVPDLERYRNAIRGFYFDLEEVPGPLCTSTIEVLEAIERLASYENQYVERYARFLERFCPLDDGDAAKRVLERLIA